MCAWMDSDWKALQYLKGDQIIIIITRQINCTCTCELGDLTHFAGKLLCYECLQYSGRCYIRFVKMYQVLVK